MIAAAVLSFSSISVVGNALRLEVYTFSANRNLRQLTAQDTIGTTFG